ncbi:MAG TPA: hypothetical protein VFL91_15550, partial [Thermomicrobiales bacterium]|nr:hypothetical protein [Thermomicrobiales bacterium]
MSSPSDPPGHLLALASGLADPAGRRETARALARAVGAEDLLVFVSDPQLAVPLPAPGFPQTLPQGRRWHEFLARCGEAAWRRGELPFPDAATVRPVAGVAGPGGAILVLVGGTPRLADAEPLRLLLPLLAATFAGEQAARAAAGHAAMAEQTAARANALAR